MKTTITSFFEEWAKLKNNSLMLIYENKYLLKVPIVLTNQQYFVNKIRVQYGVVCNHLIHNGFIMLMSRFDNM